LAIPFRIKNLIRKHGLGLCKNFEAPVKGSRLF